MHSRKLGRKLLETEIPLPSALCWESRHVVETVKVLGLRCGRAMSYTSGPRTLLTMVNFFPFAVIARLSLNKAAAPPTV